MKTKTAESLIRRLIKCRIKTDIYFFSHLFRFVSTCCVCVRAFWLCSSSWWIINWVPGIRLNYLCGMWVFVRLRRDYRNSHRLAIHGKWRSELETFVCAIRIKVLPRTAYIRDERRFGCRHFFLFRIPKIKMQFIWYDSIFSPFGAVGVSTRPETVWPSKYTYWSFHGWKNAIRRKYATKTEMQAPFHSLGA